MITGASAPPFDLPGIHQDKPGHWKLASLKGRWVVVIFYPADFSFVCPTEVIGFSRKAKEFADLGVELLGISADPAETHRSWVRELGGVAFPLLADEGGRTIATWGVTDPEEPPRALRALFVVDPEGVIAYTVVSRRNVGRSVEETLRVVRALQTKRLCPVDWKPGDPTLVGAR